MKNRPHSANGDKYLTKSIKYLYSPYKKKNEIPENFGKKMISIQSSIDRIFSAINKS